MAAPMKTNPSGKEPATVVKPYIPATEAPAELTWSAVLLGAILGIIFGTSSLYLVLKVGMTVSASIPVAVMSITLFRWLSRMFGLRPATILENNIVQTTGSAGESIAFGIGVTMPTLLLLGFEMEAVQVMTVGVLGGLLGILIMIPLRKAFIVKQHDVLPYPEGTACAEVLIAGEKGGSTAKTVFFGFGLAFLYNALMSVGKLWEREVAWDVAYKTTDAETGISKIHELPGGQVSGELTPELLGVGYIIGPKIAGITFAGGLLAYLVLLPTIKMFGSEVPKVIYPATAEKELIEGKVDPTDAGLIKNMTPDKIHHNYILYIGAGAVATGGIISMFQALPMILGSVVAGLRDLRGGKEDPAVNSAKKTLRTERDLPMGFVVAGSLGLLAAMMAVPQLGLGFNTQGAIGAGLILAFGFLFVTVSARLTGSIGSSSNPISGMTISTLLLTCLIFFAMDKTGKADTLTAIIIAGVVCVASSNGGTTAQDLKTGYLVGATPRSQQWAILIGALTSALVIGFTLIFLNQTGTIYTKNPSELPKIPPLTEAQLKDLKMEKPGGEYGDPNSKLYDSNDYYVYYAKEGDFDGQIKAGKYLVDKAGVFQFYADSPINGRISIPITTKSYEAVTETPKIKANPIDPNFLRAQKQEKRSDDDKTYFVINVNKAGELLDFDPGVYLADETGIVRFKVNSKTDTKRLTDSEAETATSSTSGREFYKAPKPKLMQVIIDGVLNQKLPWSLVILGALIAIVLELSGIPSLPFAVGIYLPLAVSTPIFIGGMIRWLIEWRTKTSAAESDTSPGVLLSSGYIAGGAIAGVLYGFLQGIFSKDQMEMFSIRKFFSSELGESWEHYKNEIPLIPFGILVLILLMVGLGWLFSGKERPPKEKVPKPDTPKPTQPAAPQKPAAPSPKPNDLERRK